MSEKQVLLEESGGIATVTLNRPERHNAFNAEIIALLADAFAEVAAGGTARALFVKAVGKSFSAGADLDWMKQAGGYSEDENVADAKVLGEMLYALHTMPCPTIAVVQGQAFGGGVGLIAACDIAVGVADARFALTEVRLGIIPAVISPYMVAAIGERSARRYFQTAETFSASEACRLGLLHEVVADAEALAEAEASIADHILRAAPGAVAAAKALIGAVAGKPIDGKVIEDTAHRIAERRASPEGKEGLTAFLEKRKPSWVSE